LLNSNLTVFEIYRALSVLGLRFDFSGSHDVIGHVTFDSFLADRAAFLCYSVATACRRRL